MSFVDEWLAETLRKINDVLPKRVEKLKKLLEMETPWVETVGGGKHVFDRKELQTLKELLPPEVVDQLYLPIVFSKNLSLGENVYVIKAKGSEAEAFRILMNLKHLPRVENQFYTYKPIVADFLNKYPSIAVVGFI